MEVDAVRIIPTIAIFYCIVVGLDLVILKYSRRSIKKKEDSLYDLGPTSKDEKDAYTTGRPSNPQQFSETSSSQPLLKQWGRPGTADVLNSYAETGSPYLSHTQA